MDYITTDFVYPPIPERHSDWAATFSSYDGAPDASGPSAMIGRGRTEAAAIKDLLEQYEESDSPDEPLRLACNMCKNETPTTELVENRAKCGPCRYAEDEHFRESDKSDNSEVPDTQEYGPEER